MKTLTLFNAHNKAVKEEAHYHGLLSVLSEGHSQHDKCLLYLNRRQRQRTKLHKAIVNRLANQT